MRSGQRGRRLNGDSFTGNSWAICDDFLLRIIAKMSVNPQHMNGIVRFACGCVGIILPTVQQQSRGEGYGFDNALVLKRCDTDYDEPSFGLSFRLLEQDKVDGAIALTAEEVKGLACDLQDLVAKGHAYYRIRALPGVK